MERNFYTDDFEHLLKETADQFKMTPSKKVWHGIYNDIHPGRRWPSIAMGLLFVFTLVLVGHLNVQQSPHSYLTDAQKKLELQNSLPQAGNKTSVQEPVNPAAHKNTTLTNTALFARNNKIKEQLKEGTKENLITPSNNTTSNQYETTEKYVEGNLPVTKTENKDLSVNNQLTGLKDINQTYPDFAEINTASEVTPLNSTNIFSEVTSLESGNANDESVKNSTSDKNISPAGTGDKNKITNAPAHIKIRKNPKISWAYYISPTVSYRTYSKQDNIADQAFLGYINTSANTGFNRPVTHRPAPGLEAGTSMKYSLAKKLKLTSGFQVNYSAYTIQANNIHPIIGTLILHDEKTGTPYTISSISYFGNGPGSVPVNLHNYSVQLSLPVGLEYQLAGNDHIQLSATGSFQPSVVVANKAYILSTDRRNYMLEPHLSRIWNMGTNIGALVSFNSNKFKWQIGPQVQYNLLSTYTNEYRVREHFINYGIRLGVSNIIK